MGSRRSGTKSRHSEMCRADGERVTAHRIRVITRFVFVTMKERDPPNHFCASWIGTSHATVK